MKRSARARAHVGLCDHDRVVADVFEFRWFTYVKAREPRIRCAEDPVALLPRGRVATADEVPPKAECRRAPRAMRQNAELLAFKSPRIGEGNRAACPTARVHARLRLHAHDRHPDGGSCLSRPGGARSRTRPPARAAPLQQHNWDSALVSVEVGDREASGVQPREKSTCATATGCHRAIPRPDASDIRPAEPGHGVPLAGWTSWRPATSVPQWMSVRSIPGVGTSP